MLKIPFPHVCTTRCKIHICSTNFRGAVPAAAPGACCNLFLCNISDAEACSGKFRCGFIWFHHVSAMSPNVIQKRWYHVGKKWTTAQGSNPVSTEEYGSAYDCIDDHQIYIPGPEHPQLSCKLVMLGMLINFFMANVPQKHTKTRPLQKWRRIGGLFSTWFQICRRSCFSRPFLHFLQCSTAGAGSLMTFWK